ncbi:hypothetical protein SDC9_118467 [bioreactor metagenome]|uniref:Uncharacterized protein n=1 Tax=bioreactor metagenome TaxID=1076179 RepID=A0A645C1K7_9ZZZZ
MIDLDLFIKHPHGKKSKVYIDGEIIHGIQARDEDTLKFHVSLNEGKHHILIQKEEILNTKLWLLRMFQFLKRNNNFLCLKFEIGYDGYFPQIEFDINLTKNESIDVSLIHNICDPGGRTESDYFYYKVNSKNKAIKNINEDIPVTKKYLTRWRLIHIFPITCVFLVFALSLFLNSINYVKINDIKKFIIELAILFASIVAYIFILYKIINKKSRILEQKE